MPPAINDPVDFVNLEGGKEPGVITSFTNGFNANITITSDSRVEEDIPWRSGEGFHPLPGYDDPPVIEM